MEEDHWQPFKLEAEAKCEGGICASEDAALEDALEKSSDFNQVILLGEEFEEMLHDMIVSGERVRRQECQGTEDCGLVPDEDPEVVQKSSADGEATESGAATGKEDPAEVDAIVESDKKRDIITDDIKTQLGKKNDSRMIKSVGEMLVLPKVIATEAAERDGVGKAVGENLLEAVIRLSPKLNMADPALHKDKQFVDHECLQNCEILEQEVCEEVSHHVACDEVSQDERRCQVETTEECPEELDGEESCPDFVEECALVDEQVCEEHIRTNCSLNNDACRTVSERLCDGFVPVPGVLVELKNVPLLKEQNCQVMRKKICPPDHQCVGTPVRECHTAQTRKCFMVRSNRNCSRSGCRTVQKEVCSLEQKPGNGTKRCHIEPIMACHRVPVKKCQNTCDDEDSQHFFRCSLVPEEECTSTQDPSAGCPQESCRRQTVDVCSMRLPGCKARRCRKFPKKKNCKIIAKNCTSNRCSTFPVRRCQPCRFCHHGLQEICHTEARKGCFEAEPCMPKCSQVYVCPICQKDVANFGRVAPKNLEKPHQSLVVVPAADMKQDAVTTSTSTLPRAPKHLKLFKPESSVAPKPLKSSSGLTQGSIVFPASEVKHGVNAAARTQPRNPPNLNLFKQESPFFAQHPQSSSPGSATPSWVLPKASKPFVPSPRIPLFLSEPLVPGARAIESPFRKLGGFVPVKVDLPASRARIRFPGPRNRARKGFSLNQQQVVIQDELPQYKNGLFATHRRQNRGKYS